VPQGLGDFRRDAQHLAQRQRTARDPLRERLALEVFHDEVLDVIRAADVKDRADVRTRQRGDGARLALESRAALVARDERGEEHFDRHRAIEARVAGAIDLAHPAGAEERVNDVRPEERPVFESHVWGNDS